MAEREDDRAAVRDALRRLPRSQREAVVLAYFGGLTADEIARRSNVPLGTAKSRIRLGLTKLRAEVESVLEPEVLAGAA
jgi:RNA polymerase sigma-70 factor (ECF subfamily)